MTNTIAQHLIGWLSCRIRALVAPTEATMRERFDQITQADAPERLVPAIKRLQYHQAFLARATIEPLPEPVRDRLEECVAQVFTETATFLHSAAAGTIDDRPRPSLGEFTRSFAAYTAALSGLRRKGIIDQLPRDEALRVEALSVRLNELRQDMESFADTLGSVTPAPSRQDRTTSMSIIVATRVADRDAGQIQGNRKIYEHATSR